MIRLIHRPAVVVIVVVIHHRRTARRHKTAHVPRHIEGFLCGSHHILTHGVDRTDSRFDLVIHTFRKTVDEIEAKLLLKQP